MKRILIITLTLSATISIFPFNAVSQMLDGVYYLTGVPETGSGFKFTPAGQFEFFFSYGAVDRFAMGTYSVDGTTLNLVSDKIPGKDFIIDKESRKGDHILIRVMDENTYLASYVTCICFIGEERKDFYANEDGVIETDLSNCSKVYLKHEMYPDAPSLIRDEQGTNTYFEVRFAPEMAKVSFQHIPFTIDADTITCPTNYLLPFDKIRYVKTK